MKTVPTITGEKITLRKIRETDIDDRLTIGRHNEFVHMCGGDSLAAPEYPERSVWENWYSHVKGQEYTWIIDLNGRCIGTAGFHNISQ